MKYKIFAFFGLFLLSVSIFSCKNQESDSPKEQIVHTVKVDNEIQKVLHGELAVKPTHVPQRDGLVLVDYFLDNNIYDWSAPVMKDLEIISKWGRDESPFDVTLDVDGAVSTWTAKYSFEGITFTIDVADSDIYTNSADIGYNDNIEIVIQAINTIKYDKRYTIDFLCDAKGSHWIKKATNLTTFGEDHAIEVNAIKGKTYNYNFELTSNGYKVSVFFSYEILNTTYKEGFGNIKFIPSGRNTHNGSQTVFKYYTKHSTMWNRPLSFITVNEDNQFVKKMYTPVDVSDAFKKSPLYDGKELLENMAQVGGEKISNKRAFVTGTPFFSDRTYSLRLYGFDDNLSGLTYLYDSINGSYGEIVEDGYVILIAPGFGYPDLLFNLEKTGFKKIISNECGLGETVSGGALDETMNYYVKWCTKGEVISFTKYYIALFAKEQNIPDHYWNTEKTIFHSDFSGHEDLDRNWQGVTSLERSKGGRLFGAWVTGGNGEPQRQNYIVVVYSDDDGKTWNNLWWSNGDYYNYTLNDPQLWVDPDGVLWIFYCQHWRGSFDGQSPTWAIKVLNPDAETLEHTEPVRIVDGLMRNKPIVLSDGTWILQGTNHCNSEYTSIYQSLDKGETWSVRSYAYLPVGVNWDESIFIERLDGSIWLTIRNTTGTIYECFSYDKGYTWTDARDTGIANPCSRFQIFKLPSGNYMMINNNHSSQRVFLTAYLSYDEGRTWEHEMLIDSGNTTYPDYAIDEETGEIWVIYDYERLGIGDIKIVHFSEEYVKENSILDSNRMGYISKLGANIPAHVDGEYLGDSSAILATDGFDLKNDNGNNPSVEQRGGGTQEIYFKNFASNSYHATTYLKARSILNRDAYPKFGFIIRNDSRAGLIYMDGADLLRNNYVGFVSGFNISTLVWDNAQTMRTDSNYHLNYLKLEIIKDSNGRFTIYVNDVPTFVDVQIDGFNSDTTEEIGFFTFNTVCDFKDYSVSSSSEEISERKASDYSCDTLFIGDSYFDPRVIFYDFYDRFPNAKNTAVYGETINYWINNFNTLVKAYNPRQIVIHIGTNDVDRGDSGETAAEEIIQLLNLIKTNLPNTKVIVFSIEPTINYWNVHEEVNAANGLIKSYVESKDWALFANFADEHLYSSDKSHVDRSLYEDGIHLNGKGIELFTQFINQYLNMLGGNND